MGRTKQPETPGKARNRILNEVGRERLRQDEKWGRLVLTEKTDGTSALLYGETARGMRRENDEARKKGIDTWRHALLEEVFEALAEVDWVALRKELIQVAALVVSWVESIDRRTEARAKLLAESERQEARAMSPHLEEK